jgi:hypothetical protein
LQGITQRRWMISTLSWVQLRGITQTRWMIDFNTLLSSVERDHTNEVNDWFQHCLEFSWGRSLKRGEWLISTLSIWVPLREITQNQVSDFNTLLSSVEGDLSNQVSDFNTVLSSVEGITQTRWVISTLSWVQLRGITQTRWMISTLSWVQLQGITQTRWIIDFNTVLSSVEGDHSNEVNDWFQHSLEFKQQQKIPCPLFIPKINN